MLSLALAGSLLAFGSPSDAGQAAPEAERPVAPAEPEAILVPPAIPPAIPPAPSAGQSFAVPGGTATLVAEGVVVVRPQLEPPSALPEPPRIQMVPAAPWSGAGRLVGGSVMLIAGLGLATAATFEYADGRDSSKLLISQIPASVAMLVAGGIMIGTGHRDSMRLAEWETATKIRAPHSGNGLIVGGVTAISLGAMVAVATSVAVDAGLDAPYSIPAGWATAGVALGGGVALLVAGIVRRSRYGKWRDGVVATPMLTPTRAGASLGLAGNF